jgi:hypothetical protein
MEAAMKHVPLSELDTIADVQPVRTRMSREERLERWADCLDRDPQRELGTLEGIEYGPAERRQGARGDNSPLAVAFADPVLREEGLASDKLGDALTFFDMTEGEAHRVFCSCLYGGHMRSGDVARRVRSLIAARSGLSVAAFGLAALVAAIPVLLYAVS